MIDAAHNIRRAGQQRPGLLLVVALLGLLLLLPGCQQGDAGTVSVVTEVVVVEGEEIEVTRLVRQTVAVTTTPAADTAVRAPTTLDAGYVGDFPRVDPQAADAEAGRDLAQNLFAGLTRYNQETNQIEGELAESWQVDGRIWTFRLRDDLYWVRAGGPGALTDVTPARPVVAADVVFAARRVCQRITQTPDAITLFVVQGCERVYNLSEPTEADLATIGVRALDPRTVQFTLTQNAGYFLTISSMLLLRPVPAAEIEALQSDDPTADWLDGGALLTSGPFWPEIGTWGSSRLVLRRNAHWPLPRPGNVETVNVNFLESVENSFRLWQAKGLDFSPLPARERADLLATSPDRARLITDQTVFYLGFNFDSGVFREPEVRRAFAAAIDRAQLADDVYGGRAIPMRHLMPPGVFAAPPVDQVGVGYSPDFARQQMELSGFRGCRLMPPFRLMISSSDLSLLQAELIRDMWVTELGCMESQIEIEQVQFGALLANTRADAGAARPDVWELGWASYFPDAHNWLSDLLHCADSENRQNRPCTAVDDRIRQAAAAADPAERTLLYREIENQFFGAEGSFPAAPLYVRGSYRLVQPWLQFAPAHFGGEQFDTYLIDAEAKRLERSR